MVAAIIVDIVGSRRIADREGAQRAIDDALARVDADGPGAVVPLHPIVGDEMQGVFAHLDAALCATLLVQLALPDGVECRYGIGLGALDDVPSRAGDISDGPAWWAAREAIDAVENLAKRTAPDARVRVAASDHRDASAVRLANAYLLARDGLVAEMTERTRRLTYGRCLGTTQRELAAAEQITQSAVSQALSASGAAAVVAGFRMLRG